MGLRLQGCIRITRGLVKHRSLGPNPRGSDSVVLRWDPWMPMPWALGPHFENQCSRCRAPGISHHLRWPWPQPPLLKLRHPGSAKHGTELSGARVCPDVSHLVSPQRVWDILSVKASWPGAGIRYCFAHTVCIWQPSYDGNFQSSTEQLH